MEANPNKPKPSQSLTVTLSIAFFSLSAIVLFAVSGLYLYLYYQTQQTALASQQLLIAQEASKAVSGFIDGQFSVLETAVDLADPISISDQEREAILESLLGLQPTFRQLILLNPQDNLMVEASRLAQASSGKIFDQLTETALTQIHQGQRYTSPIYIDDATSEPLIVMALPVTDVFGDFKGTLAVEVNLKFMWDLVDQLQVGETGYAYVVDNRGDLIAFHDTGRVLKGENVAYIIEVEEFVDNPTLSSDITPDVAPYTGLLGTDVVGAYVPLGTPQWAVVTELPWQEAYKNVIKQGIWSILITLSMAFLAGLIGVFAARRLAVPLTNLTESATKIMQGDLDLEAVVEGPTEVIQLANAFNGMTSQLRDLIGSLEQRVSERTSELEESSRNLGNRASQLEAIAEVASSVATLQDVNELLPYITKTISDRFGYYHAGIFLLSDNEEYAVLRAANSEGGQKMLARKHQLRVGQEGIVGFAVAQKRAHIALDVGEDAVYFDNPDLPATRSEMALPLIIGENVIGVLDVQSEQPNAFSNEDVEVLSTLANQVAVAIENARLFEQTQQAFKDLETTLQRYIHNEWEQYSTTSIIKGYRAYKSGLEPIIDNNQNYNVEPKTSSAHKVPITLRGVTIGHLDIDLGKQSKDYSQEELDIIHATAERVALALESARLLETSQRQAAKEQKISDITAKIGASVNMRNVLQTAVEELGRNIPGSEIMIQFQSNQEKSQEGQL